MTRATFGSPFATNMAVKQNALDFTVEFPLATKAVCVSLFMLMTDVWKLNRSKQLKYKNHYNCFHKVVSIYTSGGPLRLPVLVTYNLNLPSLILFKSFQNQTSTAKPLALSGMLRTITFVLVYRQYLQWKMSLNDLSYQT